MSDLIIKLSQRVSVSTRPPKIANDEAQTDLTNPQIRKEKKNDARIWRRLLVVNSSRAISRRCRSTDGDY